MKIGIIGTGAIGHAIARDLVKAGYTITLSNSRIEAMGFAPIDLGTLVEGGRLQQFPGGPLPTLDLVKFSKARR